MTTPETTPPRRLRWGARLGWLLVVGSIALAIMAGPSQSENQLVEKSLYFVLAFAFGVGLIVAARNFRDAPTWTQAASGAVILGLVFMAVAAAGRAYFFARFW